MLITGKKIQILPKVVPNLRFFFRNLEIWEIKQYLKATVNILAKNPYLFPTPFCQNPYFSLFSRQILGRVVSLR